MGFLKNFFASCLGSIVALILVILLGGMIFSVVISSGSEVSVNDNSVLYLDLTAPIVEQSVDDPLAEMITGGQQSIGLLQLKEAIAFAKNDSRIRGIYLNTSFLIGGTSSLHEIRESLKEFKDSGKG